MPELKSHQCPECKADLTLKDSVSREHVDKNSDDSADNLVAYGHYDKEGGFITDSFNGFGDSSYEPLDNSDTCTSCDSYI